MLEATCSEPEKVKHMDAGLVWERSKSLPTVILGAACATTLVMPMVATATATAQLSLLRACRESNITPDMLTPYLIARTDRIAPRHAPALSVPFSLSVALGLGAPWWNLTKFSW